MKFYNRENELKVLDHLESQLNQNSVMTVLKGRRRVGKTLLALHHAEKLPFIYLFTSRKEENVLCQEFLTEIVEKYPFLFSLGKATELPVIGEIRTFRNLFKLLMEIGKQVKFLLIIDEFQEFFYINPSVYSDIQNLWDRYKSTSHIHLVFIGSVYSLMHKIFETEKQPLFGRADRILNVDAFSIATLKLILQDYSLLNTKNLFDFYVLSGNMPKYLDLFIKENAKNFDGLLDIILQKDSLLLNEGKNLLIEEFGPEHLIYFTILALISEGKTSRSAIESVIGKDVGGHLARLETDYTLVSRHRPINAKPNSHNIKYKITDNFLNFWFRFIYRYRSAIELENFDYVKQLIKRDYATYCGALLERFFQKILQESKLFNQIGSYWQKDNQNEIDIVAINDAERHILIAETKLNSKKINLKVLQDRAKILLVDYPDYEVTSKGFSLDDTLIDIKPDFLLP